MGKPEEEITSISIRLPRPVALNFKAMCVYYGVQMNNTIEDLIKAWTEKKKKKLTKDGVSHGTR